MNDELHVKKFSLGLLGLPVAIALVICAIIIANTIETVKLANQTITVKGFAEKRILSDLIVWRGGFTTRGTTITEAYGTLENHSNLVKKYLTSKGIPAEQIVFSSVITRTLYRFDPQGRPTTDITGYELIQNLEVQSQEIDKIAEIARKSTELIDQGVLFRSDPPQYFYTKLGELKIEMLGEATRDARERAEQLAVNSKSKVGKLRSASMGVFQITAANSPEVSDYGIFDTSNKEKDVKAVVTVSYSID